MINFIRKKEFVFAFVKLFIIISSISAVIGIIQEILYLYAGYLFIGVIPPESLELMFENTSMGTFLRVPALMTSYGSISKMLVINLIMVANLLIYPNTFTKSTKSKLLLCFAFLLMLSALMLTFAKDAILALAIALLISALIRWRSFLIHWLFLFLILIGFCYYSGLLNTSADSISAELTFGEARVRIALDREGIEGFLDSDIHQMLFGVGMGSGARYTSHYKNWAAHNAFILAADETGLLGLLAYLALYIIAGLRLISANLMARDPQDKAITRGLLGGFIAIVIMFQFYAGYIDLIIWFYLGLIESTTLILIGENKRAKLVPNHI
jgi:cell division protein FtsW (lipid II flippase)